MHRELKSLPIAVRVYPQPKDAPAKTRSRKSWQCPEAMLVFDTETRTDATQSMTFGSYRFIVAGRCLEEGLFYGDDLPQSDLDVLSSLRRETWRGNGTWRSSTFTTPDTSRVPCEVLSGRIQESMSPCRFPISPSTYPALPTM